MESQQQSSYQEDILKVKKIWNDLRQVQQTQKLKQKLKKKQDKNKKDQIRLKQKGQNRLNKVKSQGNIKLTLRKNPQQVINFSTVSPHLEKQNKKIPSSSVFIKLFNHRQIMQKKDHELSVLRVTNQQLEDQIKSLQNKIKQKDNLIQKLKTREHQLLGSTIKNKNSKAIDQQKSVQYINYKNDTARLLKMLKTTKQFKQFAQLAIQDDGIRFLHQANRHKKSIIDAIDQKKANVHFCSCNGQFMSQKNLWIPQKAYDLARKFIRQKSGEQLTSVELQLFLFQLNQVWRQRQKRILSTADSSTALQVGKYKRKIQQIQRLSGKKVMVPQSMHYA